MKHCNLAIVLAVLFTAGAPACPLDGTGCRQLSADDISAAIEQAFRQTGAASPALRVEVLDFSRALVPLGPVEFRPAGAASPPDGIQVLHGTAGDSIRPTPIWARARVLFERTAPVATTDIPARTPIAPGQVELRPSWIAWSAAASAPSLETAVLVGAKSRRAIRAGEVLTAALVEFANDIERGQIVELHVRSGAAHLRLTATALQSARRGQPVALRLPGRDPVTARVDGPGVAVIEARGADR